MRHSEFLQIADECIAQERVRSSNSCVGYSAMDVLPSQCENAVSSHPSPPNLRRTLSDRDQVLAPLLQPIAAKLWRPERGADLAFDAKKRAVAKGGQDMEVRPALGVDDHFSVTDPLAFPPSHSHSADAPQEVEYDLAKRGRFAEARGERLRHTTLPVRLRAEKHAEE
jgi:hypothetical protein